MPSLASVPTAPPLRARATAASAVDVVVPVFDEAAARRAIGPPVAPLPDRRAAVLMADRRRRQRLLRRHRRDRRAARWRAAGRARAAPARAGPRARAAERLGAERSARRRLHGRRPLDRPARAAAAGRAAALRPLRPGDRHAAGARARVVRGPKREVISRAYNRILRLALRARFRDAQCGFKAVRTDAIRALLPEVERRRLVLRHRAARARATARPADPRGAGRLGRRPRLAREDRRDGARRPARRRAPAARQPRRALLAIGVASTVAYALLYLALRGWAGSGSGAANALALALTAVANTVVNRHWTFGIRERSHWARDGLLGTFVYLLTLGLTSGAVATLHGLAPHASRAVELGVLVVASLAATVTRYVALRSWVFARASRRVAPAATSAPRTRTAAGRPF